MSYPARYPAARWRGPVPNETPRALLLPPIGLVLHVEQGSEAGTDSWFHHQGAQASAHLGFPKVDQLGHTVPPDQWVEFTDKAWAEVAGNARWLSAETEGHIAERLDSGQLAELAHFYAWGHQEFGWPFHTSDSPTEPGFGWHGMGGDAWGGHFGCPGELRKAQRPIILAKAIMLVHPHPAQTPHQSPHETTPAYGGHQLVIGSHGPDVLTLQAHLRARGWAIPTSGAYDHQTARVVAEFQAEKHLRVDGITGPATWWAVWHLPVTA